MAKIKGIISKRLGKDRYADADHQTGIIRIDPKCKGRKDLEMLNHEGLHILCPWLDEEAVTIIGSELTRIQWERGYRRIDADESAPLQDEVMGIVNDAYLLDPPDAEPVFHKAVLTPSVEPPT